MTFGVAYVRPCGLGLKLLSHVTGAYRAPNVFSLKFGHVRKVAKGFVMSGRPSVPPHATARLPLDGFL